MMSSNLATLTRPRPYGTCGMWMLPVMGVYQPCLTCVHLPVPCRFERSYNFVGRALRMPDNANLDEVSAGPGSPLLD